MLDITSDELEGFGVTINHLLRCVVNIYRRSYYTLNTFLHTIRPLHMHVLY